MATVIVKSKRVCDLCGKEKNRFINGSGEIISANVGYVHTQGERWAKTVFADITVSIPYHQCDDICSDCLKDALMKMINNIDK